MLAVLLIVGLVVGAGVGYFMAPTKTETETETVTVEVEPLAGKTVRIGMITAETPALEWDQPFMEQILTPDINEYAELMGYDVDFSILLDDAEAQAAIHLEKVQSFKAMDISLVSGGGWSGHAGAALSYINENGILLFSHSSTNPNYAIPNDNLYRMCPTDAVQSPAIAEMLWSWGIEAIIVIQRGDSWADGIYNILEIDFPARGGVIAERIRYATDVTEFSSYLATAEAIAEDLVAEYGAEHVAIETIMFGADGSAMLSQAQDYETIYGLAWFGSDGTAQSNIIQSNAPTQAAHLVIPSTLAVPGASEVWDNLYDEYFEVTGRTFGYYSACRWDVMFSMMEGVLETQSEDALDIIPLVHPITYKRWGASGWTSLNADGDRALADYQVWGYVDIDGDVEFAQYGFYLAAANQLSWFGNGVTADGEVVPGLTPVGH
jgi:branched-chain amino acid transport system substrate-binding protein